MNDIAKVGNISITIEKQYSGNGIATRWFCTACEGTSFQINGNPKYDLLILECESCGTSWAFVAKRIFPKRPIRKTTWEKRLTAVEGEQGASEKIGSA